MTVFFLATTRWLREGRASAMGTNRLQPAGSSATAPSGSGIKTGTSSLIRSPSPQDATPQATALHSKVTLSRAFSPHTPTARKVVATRSLRALTLARSPPRGRPLKLATLLTGASASLRSTRLESSSSKGKLVTWRCPRSHSTWQIRAEAASEILRRRTYARSLATTHLFSQPSEITPDRSSATQF